MVLVLGKTYGKALVDLPTKSQVFLIDRGVESSRTDIALPEIVEQQSRTHSRFIAPSSFHKIISVDYVGEH